MLFRVIEWLTREPPDGGRPPWPSLRRGPDLTWDRLEDQISWFDRRSGDNQRRYRWLKLLELAIAAALPVVAGVKSPVWVTGNLTAIFVVL